MIKCVNCGASVIPERSSFNWIVFIALLIGFAPCSLIYLIYHLSKSKTSCPCCEQNVYMRTFPDEWYEIDEEEYEDEEEPNQ